MTVEAGATSSGASNLDALNSLQAREADAPGFVDHAAANVADSAAHITFGWFLKRAIIGIAILVVSIGGMAWLTHASIDPSQELDAANETILKSIARAADKLL